MPTEPHHIPTRCLAARSRHGLGEQCCRLLVFVLGLFLLAACGGDWEPYPLPPTPTLPPDSPQSLPTPVPIPTLFPTTTPLPAATATATMPPAATAAPATPIAFDQVVVEIDYAIPALSLERRIVGTVSSELVLYDLAADQSVARRNQGGVLLELQQALPRLELAELPPDCGHCVQLSYRLPVADLEASGWLTDTTFLASIENFTAVHLGPHFPPDTVVGLRRSASPYGPAHTVALTDAGQLWRWRATDSEVPEAAEAGPVGTAVTQELGVLSTEGLEGPYLAECDGAAIETLYLRPLATSLAILCPEYSLPARLLPIYSPLETLIQEMWGESFLERPVAWMPLNARLKYERADGKALTLFADGTVLAVDSNQTVTTTWPVAELENLIDTVAEQSELVPGATLALTGESPHLLVVRTDSGVAERGWSDTADEPVTVAVLDEMLDDLLPPAPEATLTTPSTASTPTSEATATSATEATATSPTEATATSPTEATATSPTATP